MSTSMKLAPWEKLANRAGQKTLLASMTESPKPTATPKIAAFDLDDTLLSKQGGKAGLLLFPSVLPTELQRLVADSFTIVILSNQLFKDAKPDGTPSKQELEWRAETARRVPQLDVPFYLYAATQRDYFRKPMPGMIEKHLELHNKGQSAHPDSFFVGDAAGRPKDHNDSDRKMALSVPMTFYTPEEYFNKAKPFKYILRRLHMAPMRGFGLDPFVFEPSPEPELVLLVGLPGAGKTTFYQDQMKKHGYQRITSTTEALDPTKRYALEKKSLSGSMGRNQALQQAGKAGLPVRLLRIDPPGDGPNGAWRQLVWRHHCENRIKPSRSGFHGLGARQEGLMAPKDFAQACRGYTCPHPQSTEAQQYTHGVQEVPWTYRGEEDEKDRFFRIWAETGDEKNKDLKSLMD